MFKNHGMKGSCQPPVSVKTIAVCPCNAASARGSRISGTSRGHVRSQFARKIRLGQIDNQNGGVRFDLKRLPLAALLSTRSAIRVNTIPGHDGVGVRPG